MKGGKDDDSKIMEPLFPRLHVNDTDKGGPRAPPRNKMALYEQLSIPSQRFNSTASSQLPPPPHHGTNLVPSASPSQSRGHERSIYSPNYFHASTRSSSVHSIEKFHPHPTDGANYDSARMEFRGNNLNNTSFGTVANNEFHSTAECSSLRPRDTSTLNEKKCGGAGGDDFMVPTYDHTGTTLNSNKDSHLVDGKTLPSRPMNPGRSTRNISDRPHCSHGRASAATNTNDTNSKQEKNHRDQRAQEGVAIECLREKSASQPSTRENVGEDPVSGSVQDIEISHDGRMRQHKENISSDNLSDRPWCKSNGGIVKTLLRLRGDLHSQASMIKHFRSSDEAEYRSLQSHNKARESLQREYADRTDEVSETSMVDSVSRVDVSPDDVVGVIGQKHFWKARRAMANQQRVFAVQVFELHRLIKVQKLIAGSPHLLLEENPYITRPASKVPCKAPHSDFAVKSQAQIVMQIDDLERPKQLTEFSTGTRKTSPPRRIREESLNNQELNTPPPPPPPDNNPKANPWCFQPPANQWLIPVMSPSEGLVYKPYAGPFPPAIGFMSPVLGATPPDLMHASYSVPPPPNYFPHPYGLPMMNPNHQLVSPPAVEQVSTVVKPQPDRQPEQLSMEEVNLNMQSRSSCNVSSQKSEALLCRIWKFKENSGLQGSTASSPTEQLAEGGGSQGGPPPVAAASHGNASGGDALPLFPMRSVSNGSGRPSATVATHGTHGATRAIKAVPHNRRSATENAARIFRSIQRERQQNDSL
ncbi:Protein EARLY FLOWERING 3 [Acorus calamus]|uniref:Protein EARLY FLOWERING 3 n=1 Tax=Acorus calamus TaxID=4465 RepID=A0AAV9EMD1_ACOCL|nr:Protein EARLY FLOWERING 3 [Acorus calamus]